MRAPAPLTARWNGIEPLTLTGFLPAWDVERRRFEAGPLVDWLLTTLREHGVRAERLERLHDCIDSTQALALTEAVTLATAHAAPRALLHGLITAALPELPWSELCLQTTAHLRILLPGDGIAPVPVHTDFGIGHWPDERNLWLALTDARGTAALRIGGLSDSMRWDRERRAANQVLLPQDLPLTPREAQRGELLMFTALHAHGAQTVREDATRVSFDIRLAPRASIAQRRTVSFIPVEVAR
jgi:hypothetical protein